MPEDMFDLRDDYYTDLENTVPFLKLALEGFAGSGKTRTAAEILAGLYKRIGSTKPIMCVDSEKAVVFLRRFFADRGIKVKHVATSSLAELTEIMGWADKGGTDILLIDSISHFWEKYLVDYMAEKHRKRLQFEDWGEIKPKWKREFSNAFVHGRFHGLFTGRAGYEYEDDVIEDPNHPGKTKREIHKSGIKMKAEGETAYEPDVLLLMGRKEDLMGEERKVWREAMVIKDRSGLLDGQIFKNPTYADFSPVVEYLLDGAVTRATEAERPNQFGGDEERSYWRRHAIALETLEAEMAKAGLVGQSAEVKKNKAEVLEAAFGTAAWTAIRGLNAVKLEEGVERLKTHLAKLAAEAVAAS